MGVGSIPTTAHPTNGDSPEYPRAELPHIPRRRPLEANLRISLGQATDPAKTLHLSLIGLLEELHEFMT